MDDTVTVWFVFLNQEFNLKLRYVITGLTCALMRFRFHRHQGNTIMTHIVGYSNNINLNQDKHTSNPVLNKMKITNFLIST